MVRRVTHGELMAILKEMPLFSTLVEEQLRELAELAKVSDFHRHQMIIMQGDDATTFYVIIYGLVEMRRNDEPLGRLGPGQFFGEATLVSGSAASASVLALRPTSCLMLSGLELRSFPAVVVKLLKDSVPRNQTAHPRAEVGIPNRQFAPAMETAIEFKSEKTKLLFETLVRSFIDDYMVKRLYLEQAGWKTVGELSAATKISHATLYGARGNYGHMLNELLSRGVIETRVFKGQRGRGGEVLRIRIAYDKEPVKRYVDRVVLKRKSDNI